jgi:hypothetical protein
VQIRPRFIRRVVIVVAVLLVSGAAAAMKLTSWTPANMCFCPTPDRSASAVKAEGGLEALATSGNFKVPLDTDTTAHHGGGAIGGGGGAALAESSRGKSHEKNGGKHDWTPWGKHGDHRSNSSSESAPSVRFGSFWKMMSLVGRSHHEAEATTTAHVKVAAAARISAPKPSRPPSTSGGGSVSGPGAAAPPAGSAFSEEATPVGQLASGASASASAALGAGSSGLGSARATAAANLAATPEPASFALIATGLLGIAGLIRRRRV